MLVRFAIVLMFGILTAAPAAAWAPRQCTQPAQPPGLPGNPETRADDMNARIMAYDNYVKASNSFMDCLVKESTQDGGDATSQAQAMIDAQKRNIEAFHASVFSPSK